MTVSWILYTEPDPLFFYYYLVSIPDKKKIVELNVRAVIDSCRSFCLEKNAAVINKRKKAIEEYSTRVANVLIAINPVIVLDPKFDLFDGRRRSVSIRNQYISYEIKVYF